MLRKKKDLSEEEIATLDLLFGYSPTIKLAYDTTQELTDIFEEKISKKEAQSKIKTWIKEIPVGITKYFKKFVSTLNGRMEEITNYFVHRYNSGFVEGFNNKIKVIKRRCYGIFNPENLFQRIVIDLAGYQFFSLNISKLDIHGKY